MPRMLKGGKTFKPIALVVVKDKPKPPPPPGKFTRGKYKKPPAAKKIKPTPVTGPDAGPFKGKF